MLIVQSSVACPVVTQPVNTETQLIGWGGIAIGISIIGLVLKFALKLD